LHLLLILAFVGPTLSPFSGLLVLIFDFFRIFIIYFPFGSFRLIKSHCCKRLNVVETIWKFVYSNNMATVAGFTYSKRNANSTDKIEFFIFCFFFFFTKKTKYENVFYEINSALIFIN